MFGPYAGDAIAATLRRRTLKAKPLQLAQPLEQTRLAQQQPAANQPTAGMSHWGPGQLKALKEAAAAKRAYKGAVVKRKNEMAVQVALNAEKRWR